MVSGPRAGAIHPTAHRFRPERDVPFRERLTTPHKTNGGRYEYGIKEDSFQDGQDAIPWFGNGGGCFWIYLHVRLSPGVDQGSKTG